jgi:hypothetical protein
VFSAFNASEGVMTRTCGWRTIGVVVAGSLIGCARQLPPPATPPRVVPIPQVDIGPAPEGRTTVLFDADQRALVTEVVSSFAAVGYGGGGVVAVASRPICLTPCAAHLTRGSHQLLFEVAETRAWGGNDIVQVGANPVAYRFALGRNEPHLGARIGGLVGLSLGLGALGTGGLLWAVGDSSAIGSSVRDAGTSTLLVGAGITVVSAVVLAVLRPEHQPGAGLQWELPPDRAPGATPSVTATR